MSQRIPARAGDPVGAIETPALVVDLDPFERNLDRMAAATNGIRLRPHAKSHKCATIAKLQLARGAVGICCQKTDEAAAFVDAGIGDVLVTNEIVAATKAARVAELARRARVGVLVDAPAGVSTISGAASSAGVVIDVYVEIDVGAHRCGVAPGPAALELAQAIVRAPGLRFCGLHAYHGAAQQLRGPEARRAAISSAAAAARRTREMIIAAGTACDIVTGAGTGTWHLERDSGVYDELQPGSYVFMDADYGRNTPSVQEPGFEQSLFVLAGVMSVPGPERAIVDAGLKAFAFDSGFPLVHRRAGMAYVKASDEHGVLQVDSDAPPPVHGDRVLLVPGHCDPTVNLYDWIVAIRGSRVEAVWPVEARGALG